MVYSRFEELLHSASHFFGFVLAVIGTAFLLTDVHQLDKIIVACLYSAGLLLTFGSSSIYHLLINEKLKQKFLTADHISIYLLIAGSYTPVVYFGLITWNVVIILSSIWISAIIAIYLRYAYGETGLQFVLYLLLGFNVVFYYDQLTYQAINSVYWIIAGGVLYTIGIVFYKLRTIKLNHFWWHILTVLAAICHYIGIYGLLA